MTSSLVPQPGDASPEWKTLGEMLIHRAASHPERPAVTFLNDDGGEATLTYGELQQRARRVAAALIETGCKPGDRAVLLFPPGLEFIVGFFGCTDAGLVPVPTCFPKPGRAMPRLDSAARDCQPTVLVADRETIAGLNPERLGDTVARLTVVATDGVGEGDSNRTDPIDGNDLALLQYTSGSTSEPKGVMIRHRHLLANLEAIRQGFGLPWQPTTGTECDTGVFWLPAFHDMGLIGGILEPLYVGSRTVLMSPRRFLMHPARWLEAITRFRAVVSGAPNFAYQLCADRITGRQLEELDLRRWKVAFCGAEPIAPATLNAFIEAFDVAGFQHDVFYPCYGLAEATLLASGGDGPSEPLVVSFDRAKLGRGEGQEATDAGRTGEGGSVQRLVGCGHPVKGTELLIVDPQTRTRCRESQVGEIWLRGPSVAAGYWNREQENGEIFGARLADGAGPYFRSGDLGLMHRGELFVTGRVKDVIILRGRNHYPQDLEESVREAIQDSLTKCAAFAVSGPHGESLTVVAETPRHLSDEALPGLVRQVRKQLIEEHEIDARRVVLARLGSIPLTTSGKVQRSLCRDLLQRGELKIRFEWERRSQATDGQPLPALEITRDADPESIKRTALTIERWLIGWLVQRTDVPEDMVDRDRPLAEYELDSLAAVELSGELEDWLGLELTPVLAWNHPTPARLAMHLAETLAGVDSTEQEETVDDAGLEDLLNEIESLSDDEIENAFATKRHT